MLRKSLLSILSLVLVLTLFTTDIGSAAASEDTGLNELSEEQRVAIIDAIPIMDEYIRSNGNKLKLHPKAKKEVDKFVYDFYDESVSAINKLVDEGFIELDEKNKTYHLIEQTSEEQTDDLITTFSSVNYYWWGAEWTMSRTEANRWENTFNDRTFNWGSVAAISGLLGGVFPVAIAASAAAVIMAVGNNYMYRIIRDNKNSRGVIVTFRWAPPSVTAKGR
ncbi:hypothetical protein [Halalkalibacter flavus]|uniref:hypothetical protein n=1 Tax=Halalkalibacter flavus TaxID=3090668 RepID=UPI002FC604F5